MRVRHFNGLTPRPPLFAVALVRWSRTVLLCKEGDSPVGIPMGGVSPSKRGYTFRFIQLIKKFIIAVNHPAPVEMFIDVLE